MNRLSEAHSALSEWAEYTLRDADYAGHPLWYSTITTIGRWASEGGILLSDQPPKAKIPSDRQTPERVRIVSQAYNEMPINLRLAVMCKYLAPGTETDRLKFYQKLTNHGQATYYRRWNKARELVADRLTTKTGRIDYGMQMWSTRKGGAKNMPGVPCEVHAGVEK